MSQTVRCPECATATMAPRMTTTGVEFDSCSSCNSVWFDRGEAFFFVDDVSAFALFVEEARRTGLVTDKCCPHGGEPMVALGAGGEAYLDQDSGGIWFTAEAARSLASNSRRRLEWADPARSGVTQRKAVQIKAARGLGPAIDLLRRELLQLALQGPAVNAEASGRLADVSAAVRQHTLDVLPLGAGQAGRTVALR